MGDFSIYIIKVAIMLFILFSVYKLTAGRLKCASLQRAILLAIYPTSLLIPLLKQEWFRAPVDTPVQNFDWTTLAIIAHNVDHISPEPNPIVDAVVMLMVGGSVIGLIPFLCGLIRIAKCNFSGKRCIIGDMRVTVVSSPEISPFSFGGRIFLSEEDYAAKNDMIIAHESSHIRHHHYLDLLLGRSIAITQWWNPIAWIMLREIHDVHEFQADNDVISQGHDMRDYQYLLLREAIGPQFQHITDSFNRNRLKIRLTMINRTDSRHSTRLLSLFCIPAAIAGAITVSSDSLASIINPLASAFEPNEKQKESHDMNTDLYKSLTTHNAFETTSENIAEGKLSNESSPIDATGNSRTIKQSQTFTPGETSTHPIEDLPKIAKTISHQVEPESIDTDKKIKITGDETIQTDPDHASTPSQAPQKVITSEGTENPYSPDCLIDGEVVSYESLNKLNPSRIKSISVFKDSDKHPNGLVVVELLTSEEIANKEYLKEQI